jgi:uncharacterized protein YbaR (Trm112 family)
MPVSLAKHFNSRLPFSSARIPVEWSGQTMCRLDSEVPQLVNERLGIAYPIIDGVPILIPRKAVVLGQIGEECVPGLAGRSNADCLVG